MYNGIAWFVGRIFILWSSCLSQIASLAPSATAMYSTSEIESEEMSYRRVYHSIVWPPILPITLVVPLACSPGQEASTTISISKSLGLLKHRPTYFVEYKYANMLSPISQFHILGSFTRLPSKLTAILMSGHFPRAMNRRLLISYWHFVGSAGLSCSLNFS
jgi:hypothetical protein